MKKYVTVVMPDNSVWAVPTSVVAEHHAKYFADCSDGRNIDETMRVTTLPLFEADEDNILNWAANRMVWKDFEGKAIRVKSGAPNYDQG